MIQTQTVSTNTQKKTTSSTSTTQKKKTVIPDVLYHKYEENGEQKRIKYLKGNFLGKGGFAECYELINAETKQIYAGKIIPKESITNPKSKQKLKMEIKIHRSLSHHNIVQFKDFFEEQGLIIILLEMCSNKSMMELIKKRGKISEPEAMFYLKQVVDAVQYMHDKKIIHRDLKLGNIFISKNIDLKIGDFGLATVLEYDEEKKKTICGTPNYIAPEILEGKNGHSYEVDLWSIGVIIYTWVVGKPPFETTNLKTTYKRIQSSIYEYPPNINLSPQVKDLIRQLLQTDPSARPSLSQVLEHPWLQESTPPRSLPSIAMLRTPPRNELLQPSYLTQTLKPQKLPFSGQNVNQMILSPHKRFSSNDQRDKENFLNAQNLNNERKRKKELLPNNLEENMAKLDLVDNENKSKVSTRISSVVTTNVNNNIQINTNKEKERTSTKQTTSNSPNKGTSNVIDGIFKTLVYILDGKKDMNELKVDKEVDNKPLEIFIKDYQDHSEKYGVSYLLHGNCFGAFFNDATSIITDPDGVHVSYIERHVNNESIVRFDIKEYPTELEKKVCLLKHFTKNLVKSKYYDPFLPVTEKNELIYVKKWLKTSQATFFRLSNGILQVNFEDRTCIVLNNGGLNCLYKNKSGKESVFSLLDLQKHTESNSISSRLTFVRCILNNQKRN